MVCIFKRVYIVICICFMMGCVWFIWKFFICCGRKRKVNGYVVYMLVFFFVLLSFFEFFIGGFEIYV